MKGTVVFTLLLVTVVGYSQNKSESTKLTYEEAIKIGLKNNVILNQQKNTLFSRQVSKNASIANLAPNLFAQGQVFTNVGQQPNPENGDLQNLSVTNAAASLNANLVLFNGLSRISTLQQNTSLFKAQTSLVKRAEQDAIFAVTNQYLQVLLDQELLRIAEENFKAQSVLVEQTRESVNLGARPESDLYNQDAQAKNMELIAVRAKMTLENDKAILAQTLQLDPIVPLELAMPSLTFSLTDASKLDLDSLTNAALTTREDLKQFNHQMDASQYAHRAALGLLMPTVTAFASYGSNYYSSLVNAPISDQRPDDLYGNFGNQFRNIFPNTTYGLNFNVPIFSRMASRNSRVQAKVQYDNAKILRDNLEKTIKLEVKRAYNNYVAAIEAHRTAQAQLESGALALRVQTESYGLGVANQVTLAQANQTYVQAASSKAQADVTLVFQKILLEYALGTLIRPE
ncbi:MAG: TolC family protein [Bacteroidota bacterium]